MGSTARVQIENPLKRLFSWEVYLWIFSPYISLSEIRWDQIDCLTWSFVAHVGKKALKAGHTARFVLRPRQSGIWDCRLHLVEYFKRAILKHDMNRVGTELIKVYKSPGRLSDEIDSWYSCFTDRLPVRNMFVRRFRPWLLFLRVQRIYEIPWHVFEIFWVSSSSPVLHIQVTLW